METLWDVISVTCVFIVTLVMILAAFGAVKIKSVVDDNDD